MEDLSGLMWTTSQKPTVGQQQSQQPKQASTMAGAANLNNSNRAPGGISMTPMMPGSMSSQNQMQSPSLFGGMSGTGASGINRTPSYSVGTPVNSIPMTNGGGINLGASASGSMNNVPRFSVSQSTSTQQFPPMGGSGASAGAGLSAFPQMNASLSAKNSSASINVSPNQPQSRKESSAADAFENLVSFGSDKKLDMSKLSLAEQQKYKLQQQQQSSSNILSPAVSSASPVSTPISASSGGAARPMGGGPTFASASAPVSAQSPQQQQLFSSPSSQQLKMQPAMSAGGAAKWDFDAMLTASPSPVQKPPAAKFPAASGPSVNGNHDVLADFLGGSSPAYSAAPGSAKPETAAQSISQTQSPSVNDPFAIFNTPPVKLSPAASPQANGDAQTAQPVVAAAASPAVQKPTEPVPVKKQPTASSSEPAPKGPSLDENLSKMVEIGFDVEDSRLALQQNNNNYQASVEWLLHQPQSSLPSSAKAKNGSNNDLANKISKMTGLSQKRAEKAGQFLNAATEAGFSLFNRAKNLVADTTKKSTSGNGGDFQGQRLGDDYEQGEFVDNSYSRPGGKSLGASRESLSSVPTAAPVPKTPPSQPKKLKRPTGKVSCPPHQLVASETFKNEGNAFFKQGQYGDAEEKYAKAIESLPEGHLSLIPLLNNRAAARLKNGTYKDCIQDCSLVEKICLEELKYEDTTQEQIQEFKDSISKALLRRATAYENIEKWEDAGKDYRLALEYNPGAKGASEGIRRCAKATKVNPATAQDPQPPSSAAAQPSGMGDFADFIQPVSSTRASKPAAAPTSVMNDLNFFAAPPPQAEDTFKSENVEKLRRLDAEKEREDAEKLKAKDHVDAKLMTWKVGKEKNLRALIASVDTVLWAEMKSDWKPVNMSELVTSSQVKVKYMRVIAKLHPDKLSNMTLTAEQKLLANGIFGTLNDAWDAFKLQNNVK